MCIRDRLVIETMYPLYHDRLKRPYGCYPGPEHLPSRPEVESRKIYPFAHQQSVHIIVEQIDIQGVQIFEIIMSVLIDRRLTPFQIIIISPHVKGLQPVYPQLHAQPLGKSRLAGG